MKIVKNCWAVLNFGVHPARSSSGSSSSVFHLTLFEHAIEINRNGSSDGGCHSSVIAFPKILSTVFPRFRFASCVGIHPLMTNVVVTSIPRVCEIHCPQRWGFMHQTQPTQIWIC